MILRPKIRIIKNRIEDKKTEKLTEKDFFFPMDHGTWESIVPVRQQDSIGTS